MANKDQGQAGRQQGDDQNKKGQHQQGQDRDKQRDQSQQANRDKSGGQQGGHSERDKQR